MKTTLKTALENMLDDASLKTKIAEQGITIRRLSGQRFRDMIRDENERYRAIIACTHSIRIAK